MNFFPSQKAVQQSQLWNLELANRPAAFQPQPAMDSTNSDFIAMMQGLNQERLSVAGKSAPQPKMFRSLEASSPNAERPRSQPTPGSKRLTTNEPNQGQNRDVKPLSTPNEEKIEQNPSSQQAAQASSEQSQSSQYANNTEDKDESSLPADDYDEPILWFLTGHLEQLSPLSIPQLVLNNEFVQAALEAESPQDYLNQKQSAGAWLDQLGIPLYKQELILEENMLSRGQEISAYQLFKEMGLNAQTIRDELSQLQNQLPLDGLTPHMVRAAALRSQIAEQSDLESDVAVDQHRARSVSHDPFQNIQKQWDPETVQKIDLTSASSEQPWINTMQEAIQDSSKLTVDSHEPTEEGLEKQIVLENPVVSSSQWQSSEDISQENVTLYKLSDNGFMPLEADTGMGSQDQNPSSQPDHRDFTLSQNIAAKVDGISQADQGKWSQELQSPNLSRIRQEIINRAEILVKEGGGSIKIDLGHEDLGQIDLAIEVNDQKLEIRILAGSEKARELIAQELPRLREALQLQNLDLQSVEVGLRQESSWSQSFNDGSQNQGHSWQEQSEAVEGPWQIKSSKRAIHERTWGPGMRNNSHNGQIQVRV